jgi:hypothetical protein
MRAEIWISHLDRQVLLTDEPGVPTEVCGFVSEAARDAAVKRGYATVSEIGFPSDVHLGPFECPEDGGWGEAGEIAKAKARELGYELEYYSIHFDYSDDEFEGSATPFTPFWEFGDDYDDS